MKKETFPFFHQRRIFTRSSYAVAPRKKRRRRKCVFFPRENPEELSHAPQRQHLRKSRIKERRVLKVHHYLARKGAISPRFYIRYLAPLTFAKLACQKFAQN